MSRSSLGTPVYQELKPPRFVSAVHPCTYVQTKCATHTMHTLAFFRGSFRCIRAFPGRKRKREEYIFIIRRRARAYACPSFLINDCVVYLFSLIRVRYIAKRNKDFVIINQCLCVSTSVKDEHRRNWTREFKSIHAIENTFVHALRSLYRYNTNRLPARIVRTHSICSIHRTSAERLLSLHGHTFELRLSTIGTIRASIVCASYHEMRFGKEERSRPTDLVKHLLVVLVRFYRLICRTD
ncbi:unnamed protein product [Trichogramma brassicae]|uniref:Uncharacterized protein n=1 Tax=Trichogramma brassicae TaxID=86971 RepID=A0A6H5I9U8_9HYME|nr:unnamed protein product [Trichogramma brassicae]